MIDRDTTDQQKTLARFEGACKAERESEQEWEAMMAEDETEAPSAWIVALVLVVCITVAISGTIWLASAL